MCSFFCLCLLAHTTTCYYSFTFIYFFITFTFYIKTILFLLVTVNGRLTVGLWPVCVWAMMGNCFSQLHTWSRCGTWKPRRFTEWVKLVVIFDLCILWEGLVPQLWISIDPIFVWISVSNMEKKQLFPVRSAA